MARVDVPVQELAYQGGPNDITASGTAGDAANDHVVTNHGNELLFVENAGASPCIVTCVSRADIHGRTGDTVVTVPAGGAAVIGPFNPDLFNQAGGVMNIDLDQSASVTLAWFRPAAKRGA